MTIFPAHSYMDPTELAALIRSKQLSPIEVAQSHLDRIEVAKQALEAAEAAETAVTAGAELGALQGGRFTAKDALAALSYRDTRGHQYLALS